MQSIPQTTSMTQPTVQIPTQSDFSRVYEANLQRVENTVTKAIDSIALDIRELKQQDAAVKQLYEERFRRLEDNINDTKRAVYVQQDNNRRYQETVDKQIESFKELMLKESERNDERALEQSESLNYLQLNPIADHPEIMREFSINRGASAMRFYKMYRAFGVTGQQFPRLRMYYKLG